MKTIQIVTDKFTVENGSDSLNTLGAIITINLEDIITALATVIVKENDDFEASGVKFGHFTLDKLNQEIERQS